MALNFQQLRAGTGCQPPGRHLQSPPHPLARINMPRWLELFRLPRGVATAVEPNEFQTREGERGNF
jgi:hypothetical protein